MHPYFLGWQIYVFLCAILVRGRWTSVLTTLIIQKILFLTNYNAFLGLNLRSTIFDAHKIFNTIEQKFSYVAIIIRLPQLIILVNVSLIRWSIMLSSLKKNISSDKRILLSYIVSVGVIWMIILCILTSTLQGENKYCWITIKFYN